ncbi:MAG: hypothetical protein R2910_09995 [Gemmatimonadales bacterium]
MVCGADGLEMGDAGEGVMPGAVKECGVGERHPERPEQEQPGEQ